MWITDKNDRRIAVGWRQACEAAAGPEFDRFRQLPMIDAIVGNHRDMADYQIRRAYRDRPGAMDLCAKQLSSGSQFGGADLAAAELQIHGQRFCLTECRYLAALADILEICSQFTGSIAEIGGGYGGLCRMLCYSYPGIAYNLIDVPQALKLQERFSQARLADDTTPPFNLRLMPVSILSTPLAEIEVDLVIGMYSFSELGYIERTNYQKLIQLARLPRKSFAWNYLDDESDLLTWQQAKDWFEELLGHAVQNRWEILDNPDSGHIIWW